MTDLESVRVAVAQAGATPFDRDAAVEKVSAMTATAAGEGAALVLFPGWLFDGQKERAVQLTAPLLTEWVTSRYRRIGPLERFNLFLPNERVRPVPDADS